MPDISVTTERPVTTEDETIVAPCPVCAKDIERTIPAGTLESVAGMMRKLPLTCTACTEAREAAEERQRHEQRVALRRENCNLPVMLRGLTFDSYDTSRPGAAEAKAAAEAWAAGRSPKRGLILVGPVGVGKTRLAATAGWAALERMSVRYVNVAELIVKLTAAFGDRERADALSVLTGKGPIILDDFDKVNPSMHVLAQLYTAIEGRVQAGAPMIVTTNLRSGPLLEKLSSHKGDSSEERQVAAQAIVSRLVGHCQGLFIEGEDGRR